MPLDINSLARPTKPGDNFPRLDPKVWLDKVTTYRDLVKEQHAAEQTARSLKARADALKSELARVCGDAPVAFCGKQVLTWSDTAGVDAQFTLVTGEKIKLAELRALMLPDGRSVPPQEVATIYGGRSAYRKLDVRP